MYNPNVSAVANFDNPKLTMRIVHQVPLLPLIYSTWGAKVGGRANVHMLLDKFCI